MSQGFFDVAPARPAPPPRRPPPPAPAITPPVRPKPPRPRPAPAAVPIEAKATAADIRASYDAACAVALRLFEPDNKTEAWQAACAVSADFYAAWRRAAAAERGARHSP